MSFYFRQAPTSRSRLYVTECHISEVPSRSAAPALEQLCPHEPNPANVCDNHAYALARTMCIGDIFVIGQSSIQRKGLSEGASQELHPLASDFILCSRVWILGAYSDRSQR